MKKYKKFLSLVLSTLLVVSSMFCGTAIASEAAGFSEGDLVLYKYVVQTDSIIEAFEGTVNYPSDSLKICSSGDITVYDGETGSWIANDYKAEPGTVYFNASNAFPVYNFTKDTAMILILFEVTNADFNPEDISTTLVNFYDDDGFINNTNNPYNYKNVIDDLAGNEEVISGGCVDIDKGENYTTAPTEPETTEYVAPDDVIYFDYKVSGGHSLGEYDTPFTNNDDGTYTLSIPYSGVNTICSLYNETTGKFYTVSALTSVSLQLGAEPAELILDEKDSRTSLIFSSTSTGVLVLTFDYDTRTLTYELKAEESDSTESETVEPTEPESTSPTTEPAPTESETTESTEPDTTSPTTEPSDPVAVEYTVIYCYTTNDGEQTLTKTVTTKETDPTAIANLVAPTITNPYASYSLGECSINGTTVNAVLVATEKKYTVTVDGKEVGAYGYKDKITVQLNGADYTFYVTGNIDLISGEEKLPAEISLDGITASDTQVSMEILATANVENFSRMGIVFATDEKSETEIAAAVAEITKGTASSNGIAVHNSTVDTANESGSYQFTYVPFVKKDNANKILYFYTFVVDTDGKLSISSSVSVNLANACV